MIVALFGSTGQLGREVLRLLIERGHQPRVLVRNIMRLTQSLDQDQVVEGDVHNPKDVARTVGGAEAVISTLGMADISQPATDLSDGLRNIVSAMKTRSLKRVIAVGGASVLPHPDGGLRKHHDLAEFLVNVSAEHFRQWQILSESGKDWTLVCPVFFSEDVPNTRYRVLREGLPPMSDFVSIHDLAEFIVQELQDGQFLHSRVGIVSDRLEHLAVTQSVSE
ncbi:MAG: NAD(P)H-binding protein [Fimbriimonadaceae bacterium]